MAREKKTSKWVKIRKFLNDIHLWVGLTSGLILLVVCFTGTIYVYNTEIREWGASHLYKVSVPAGQGPLSIEEVIEKEKGLIQGIITGIKIPYDADRSYQITAKAEGDKG